MASANLASPNSIDPNDPRQKQLGGPVQNVPQGPVFRNFTDFMANPMAQDRVNAMLSQGGGIEPSASQQASMQAQGIPMRQTIGNPPPFTPPAQATPAVQPSPAIPTQAPTPVNLPSVQDRLSSAAGLQPPPHFQQWQQQNPDQQEKPMSGFMKALQIAAGIVGGGVPGAAQSGMAIHQHDLPAGLQGVDTQRYQQQVMQPYTAQLGALDTSSQIQQRQGVAALDQGKLQQLPLETEIKREAAQGTLANHGLKQVTDDQGNVSIQPDEDSPVYQHQQAQTQYIGAQQQLDAARTQYQQAAADAKTNPNNPTLVLRRQALAIAMKNAQTAAGRLGLSTLQYDMRAHGTDATGNALPGAALEDDGTPVGTAFQQNVRPTGTERNKGDMATSAHEQLGTLKDIVGKRPDIFGPASGRVTDFNVWLGSQDPDAQRFRAARTIAGDHLAGTFGGRSEAALSAIDNAIGNFKDNPAAVSAGLDQLDKANSVFLKRGTPNVSNGRGGRANAPSTSQGGDIPDQAAAQLKEGLLHTFGNGQVWTKKNGNPVRVR